MSDQTIKVSWKTFQAAGFDGIPLPSVVRVAKRLKKAGKSREANGLLYLAGAALYQDASARKAKKKRKK